MRLCSTHCDKWHSKSRWVHPFVLESTLQLLGLCENWLEMVPNISRCHGCMHIQFMEGGFNLSR